MRESKGRGKGSEPEDGEVYPGSTLEPASVSGAGGGVVLSVELFVRRLWLSVVPGA